MGKVVLEGQLGLHTIRYNREESNSNDQFKTKIIMVIEKITNILIIIIIII